eukprot:GDKI01031377.1.p1 GENE.GDKI01031377.1~~GDKI01031377.1.p1  ORF type:complete len:145 (+),score=14.85 GDKI01031377.1:53-487(+)
MIYCFYVYHRQFCVYYEDWNRTRKPKDASAEEKLISGLLFGIKGFTQKVSPMGQPGFNCITTPLFKLHYYETMSGYKLVFMTDPTVQSMVPHLQRIYSDIFLEHVIKAPGYTPGGQVASPSFQKELNSFVRSVPWFVTPPACGN